MNTHSAQAEQAVIGALLNDNDAIDRIVELQPSHFYNSDHQAIFTEICRQITAGKRSDAVTVYEAVQGKINDCFPYLISLTNNSPSSANIVRHADAIIDKALKRSMAKIASEMIEATGTPEHSSALIDRFASGLDDLSQKKTSKQPRRLSETLGDYADLMQARLEGKIRLVKTGFADLDHQLGGGFERQTMVVVAGRPRMGKSAFGLTLARNTAEWGSCLYQSMEMPEKQVNDRNISALAGIPLRWIRTPDDNPDYWNRFSAAYSKADTLNLFIDDETALSIPAIRSKSRYVKRKQGLDILVVDQLSFITGSDAEEKRLQIGDYTRGLLKLAKELDIVVVLLCQLNRDCEKRSDKRPIMSDLAESGSIEQDAETIIFLYRDEIYNEHTEDKGICEAIIAKQRQGEPGVVGLAYIGAQTRFESLAYPWQRRESKTEHRRGFD